MAGVTEEMIGIGQRLKLLRYALGFGYRKMSAFCRRVGISNPSQWHQYEDGSKRISVDEALKVSILTGASLDWIYRGDDWLWTMPGRLVDAFPAARAAMEQDAEEHGDDDDDDRAGARAGEGP